MKLYKSVKKEADAEQIIEKSRFIAHVKPVETREEADAFIDTVKSRFKDATHNVPAMVLGDKFQVQWASDDGEPQGTSGAPIVQMMVKEGITNAVVVVTRYFGGIKLGTGGLVRAYTSSAKLGIEAAQVCGVFEICMLKIKTDYTFLSKLQNLASETFDENGPEYEFIIDEIQYTDKVTMDLFTTPEKKDKVIELLANTTSGTAEIIEEKTLLKKI